MCCNTSIKLIPCRPPRPATAQRVQVSRLGNPSHVAGDVQLQDAPHPAALQGPAAQPPAQPGRGSPDQPEPAASVVGVLTAWHCCGAAAGAMVSLFTSLSLRLLPQRGEHGPAADHRSGEFGSAAAVHALPQRPQDGAVGRVGGAEPSLDPNAGQSHACHWWAFADPNFTRQSKQPVCRLNVFLAFSSFICRLFHRFRLHPWDLV